jgi:hypothetical protein
MAERHDRQALRYAGMMGHEYAALADYHDPITGVPAPRVCGEYDTIQNAKKHVKPHERVYVRSGKTWLRVMDVGSPD